MSLETQPEQIGRLMRSAALASIVAASVLIVTKGVVWWWSGSVSVLASLADSMMDVLASALNYVAVRYALQPADEDHRFGHGKAEFLAGLAQALFIGSSAVFLFVQAVSHLMEPRPIEAVGAAIGVMVFSLGVTGALVTYQRHVIQRTGSVAIKADALHYLTDIMTNAGVLVALGAAAMGWGWVDPAVALCFSLYIAWNAIGIGREAGSHLMDRELSEDVLNTIREVVGREPEVRGLHGLRTRQSGRVMVIQMHLEMDGDMPLREAHEIAERIEQSLMATFPGADVIIHQDPHGSATPHP